MKRSFQYFSECLSTLIPYSGGGGGVIEEERKTPELTNEVLLEIAVLNPLDFISFMKTSRYYYLGPYQLFFRIFNNPVDLTQSCLIVNILSRYLKNSEETWERIGLLENQEQEPYPIKRKKFELPGAQLQPRRGQCGATIVILRLMRMLRKRLSPLGLIGPKITKIRITLEKGMEHLTDFDEELLFMCIVDEENPLLHDVCVTPKLMSILF
jgi:hypothetical protein